MGTFKLKSLEQKMKKAGLVAVKKNPDSAFFHVEGRKGYYGSFFIQKDYNNEEEAVCVSVCPNGDDSDGTIDYYPQTYCNTIKHFINALA
jgi:hypothetical protein